jgi:ABC-2 type transport system ATP-binding protein
MDIVATHHLTKRYGDAVVVDGLDLRVPRGSVYGFLGPNGSGKSTTMKMLLGLVQPTEGDVRIMGRPMTRSTRRAQLAHIGSLIESPPGYGHLTGGENMRLVGRALGLRREQLEDAVSTVRLEKQMDKRVRDYSLGMKQRLGIAMALARDPDLLILDEPTNGLDPAGIEEIRALLRRLADQGTTVMVSSHLLGEIDRTANVLGILKEGTLLFQGTRAELMGAASPDVVVETGDPARACSTLNRHLPTTLDGSVLRLGGLTDDQVAFAVSELVHAGVPVHGVRREEQSLEDVFMNLTQGAAA